MTNIGIIGGSGYTGVELLRLLLPRDDLHVSFISSRANAGTRVDGLFSSLRAPALIEKGVKVVDLSADYRIKDVATWEKWYGMTHASPAWIDKAIYGLPEINRVQIADAMLVANPGCYPTTVQLGFMPLLENDVVETV